jgi:hypothetical protein
VLCFHRLCPSLFQAAFQLSGMPGCSFPVGTQVGSLAAALAALGVGAALRLESEFLTKVLATVYPPVMRNLAHTQPPARDRRDPAGLS